LDLRKIAPTLYVKVSAEEAAIFDFLSAQKNKRQMFYYPGHGSCSTTPIMKVISKLYTISHI
jgi:hypothetical protein